jgi:hypothetical protein
METFRPFEGEVFFLSVQRPAAMQSDSADCVSCSLLPQAWNSQRKERQIRLLTYGRKLTWVAPRLHRPIIGDVVAFFASKIP